MTNPENIILSEISESQKEHSDEVSRAVKFTETESRIEWWLPAAGDLANG